MKAIILGANGYIGMHLAMQVQQMGWEVHVHDVQEKGQDWFKDYSALDIRNKENLNRIDTNVDFIFFFSGLTGTLAAYDQYENYIDVNEKGLLHLLDLMKKQNSSARIIFPSTRLVYKGVEKTPLKENAEKECKTIYATNKLSSEWLLKQYSDYFGIQYTIFRICVPYGNEINGNYSYGTIGFFLKKALAAENIVLFGDGEQRRTFTHIADLTASILHTCTLKKSVNEVYNTGGENFSLKQVAGMIAEKYHIQVEHIAWPRLEQLLESGDTIFDATKLEAHAGKNFFSHKLLDWITRL
jgi:UDP-glucose 4-epimerase